MGFLPSLSSLFGGVSPDEKALQRAQKDFDKLCVDFSKVKQLSDSAKQLKESLVIIRGIVELVSAPVKPDGIAGSKNRVPDEALGKKAAAFFGAKIFEDLPAAIKMALINQGFTGLISTPGADTSVRRESFEYLCSILKSSDGSRSAKTIADPIRTAALLKIREALEGEFIPLSQNTIQPLTAMGSLEKNATIRNGLEDLRKGALKKLITPKVYQKPVVSDGVGTGIDVTAEHDIPFILSNIDGAVTPNAKAAYAQIIGEALVSGKLRAADAKEKLVFEEVSWPLEDRAFTALCKMAINTISMHRQMQEVAGHYVCAFIEQRTTTFGDQQYMVLKHIKESSTSPKEQKERATFLLDLLGSDRANQMNAFERDRFENGGFTNRGRPAKFEKV